MRDPAELAWRIVAAAHTAGLGLTLLPVFYAHAGFGGTPTTAGQRRFVHTTYTFSHLFDRLREGIGEHGYVLGIAPHSLRAVTPEELGQVVRLAAPGAPIHIHAAEQTQEVDDCFAWSRHAAGRMAADAGERRCALVHRARDAHDREGSHRRSRRAARWRAWRRRPKPTWATARFRARPIWPPAAGSAWAAIPTRSSIRSPSCGSSSGRSGCAREGATCCGDVGDVPIGTTLWAHAARRRRAGAGAAGRRHRGGPARRPRGARSSTIRRWPGRRRDDVLDAAIFGPARAPVRDVMAGGKWIVRDGRHAAEEEVLARYRAALARLDATP